MKLTCELAMLIVALSSPLTLAEELTRDKTSVTITFKSHPDATARRLFGCVMIRGKET